jgi:uncharacterized protein (TIGR02300 family)
LANPELGTKQICPQCQAKFYDLNKRPAHCPKCDAEFDPDEAVRNRRVRARAVAPDTEADEERPDKVVEEVETDEDEEEVVTPELDEEPDEPLVADDDDEGAAPAPGAGGDDLGEFSDDEEVEDNDDVPFLEEDEDDFDDSEIEGLPDEGDED